MTTSFAVTWDYRCPYARNAHEHVVTGLEAGADWDVTFLPFSLSQVHVEEGDAPVWDDPTKRSGLLAMEVALVVRDTFPEAFHRTHCALFAARHDEARDIRQEAVLRDVLQGSGVDAETVFGEIEAGWPLEAFRQSHEEEVARWKVFGVPTFISGDRSVFVRITSRPAGDGEAARHIIDGVIDLLDFAELNEFKHTSIRR